MYIDDEPYLQWIHSLGPATYCYPVSLFVLKCSSKDKILENGQVPFDVHPLQ
jgi:hypothetical protein